MLFLKFRLGEVAYALEAAHIVEVLPLVELRELRRGSAAVAGAFNYHGTLVPVVDLGALTGARSAERRLSTRLVIVRHRGLVGLIAERATETIECDPESFVTTDAGPMVLEGTRFIQRVNLDTLLPSHLYETLNVA